MTRSKLRIPVIDLFAGPGGLGEGFSAIKERGVFPFQICLSIEKERAAYRTLLLRSFFRQFSGRRVPEAYYRYLRGTLTASELFEAFPKETKRANDEVMCAELGKESERDISTRIIKALKGKKTWVLIGGPPCQAYSIVGRSRHAKLRAKDIKAFEKDKRHYLYKEYLRILAEHQPTIFIMENVKGILSSKIAGQKIFDQILRDLKEPSTALGRSSKKGSRSKALQYNLFSLTKTVEVGGLEPVDFVLEAEKFGIPQSRHRVIILGVRSDVHTQPLPLKKKAAVTVEEVISDLPKLRSRISRDTDSGEKWVTLVKALMKASWFRVRKDGAISQDLYWRMLRTLNRLKIPKADTGGRFVQCKTNTVAHRQWYKDSRMGGVCGHESRSHMGSDLYRYFFAASYAFETGKSPELPQFPKPLLPKHKNATKAVKDGIFDDRFRVQVWQKPSSTVVSHIKKDGHYFIHPDPAQCRTLTPREAARLQTFPDNYFFEGTRTCQYEQIGNAVPPLLAKQIAGTVYNLLEETGRKRE